MATLQMLTMFPLPFYKVSPKAKGGTEGKWIDTETQTLVLNQNMWRELVRFSVGQQPYKPQPVI